MFTRLSIPVFSRKFAVFLGFSNTFPLFSAFVAATHYEIPQTHSVPNEFGLMFGAVLPVSLFT